MSFPSHFSSQQRSIYKHLVELGIPAASAASVAETNPTSIEAAVDRAFSAPSSTALVPVDSGASNKRSRPSPVSPPPLPTSAAAAGSASNPIPMDDESDAQMQEAVRASLMETAAPSSDDAQMNAAILASLKTSTGDDIGHFQDPSDPHKRARDPALPVGLKNSGNLCYLNSLLQFYYLLRPTFLHELFSTVPPADYHSSASLTAPQKNSIEFLAALQKLFAGLYYSDRKYMDPIHCVNALFKVTGQDKNKKEQNDPAEFNELILDTLDTAFKSIRGPDCEIIKHLFYGECQVAIEALNDRQERIESHSKEPVSHIIIDIGSGALMSAIDNYFFTTIDNWRIPNSQATAATAEKSLAFQSIPPVLSFQLRRVVFDKERREAIKSNERFSFETEIYMDRYLEANKSITRQRREKQKQLEMQRNALESELKSLTKYQISDANAAVAPIALDAAFQATAEFLQRDPEAAALSGIINELLSRGDRIRTRIAQLRHLIAELNGEIGQLFADLRECKYSLHAVLIHDGRTAGEGHYWCYAFRRDQGKWYKYNDSNVQVIEESAVLEEAFGGRPNKNGSAYFLVYVKSSTVEGVTQEYEKQEIPQLIQSWKPDVIKDNESFAAEIVAFDQKQIEKEVNQESEKLFQSYQNAQKEWKEVDKAANEARSSSSLSTPNQRAMSDKSVFRDDADLRLKSFSWFLHKDTQARKMQLDELQLAKEVFASYQHSNAERRAQILSAAVSKLKKASFPIAHQIVQLSPEDESKLQSTMPPSSGACSPDRSAEYISIGSRFYICQPLQSSHTVDSIEPIYHAYVITSELITRALDRLYQGRLLEAIYLILEAAELNDAQLSAQPVARTREATSYTQLMLLIAYERIKLRVGPREANQKPLESSESAFLFRCLCVIFNLVPLLGGEFAPFFGANFVSFRSTEGIALSEQQCEQLTSMLFEDHSALDPQGRANRRALIKGMIKEITGIGNAAAPSNSPALARSHSLDSLFRSPLLLQFPVDLDPVSLYTRYTQNVSRFESSFKHHTNFIGRYISTQNEEEPDEVIAEAKKLTEEKVPGAFQAVMHKQEQVEAAGAGQSEKSKDVEMATESAETSKKSEEMKLN